MFESNVEDKWVRKDSWVKELLKTHNPEMLAGLIQKRIEKPSFVGPFIRSHLNEQPSDIIDAFIASDGELRERIYPAVGLMLYNLLHGKVPFSHDVLRGVFSIIGNSRLRECYVLLVKWLEENKSKGLTTEIRWETTYREGMLAFARIQQKDPLMELYWLNIWRSDVSGLWAAAFTGLRGQNPEMACVELPLLVRRKLDKMQYLLLGMWNDLAGRKPLVKALKAGIVANVGWGGLAVNALLGQLKEEEKQQLMLTLR